jgi:hypothetical protein
VKSLDTGQGREPYQTPFKRAMKAQKSVPALDDLRALRFDPVWLGLIVSCSAISHTVG